MYRIKVNSCKLLKADLHDFSELIFCDCAYSLFFGWLFAQESHDNNPQVRCA